MSSSNNMPGHHIGKLALESTVKLSSGASLPRLGYGVYQARGKECTEGVVEALKAGYRHIDSAQAYRNEDLVREGVSMSKVPRQDIFLTTKYMSTHKVHPVDSILPYLRSSLPKIDVDAGYIDLMLIHAPFGGKEGRANNWAALAQAQKEGWIKDIGVSNFGVKHLEELPEPLPAINQIELHPWCQQKEIVNYCREKGIIVQAYTPIVRGDPKLMQDPVIVRLCEKHKKDAAQIMIRWSLQSGFIPLPKSVTPSRIKSNAEIYDFELDKEDMDALAGLDKGEAGAITWNPVNSD